MVVLCILAIVGNCFSISAVNQAEDFREFWESYAKGFFEKMREHMKRPKTASQKMPRPAVRLFWIYFGLYIGIAVYASIRSSATIGAGERTGPPVQTSSSVQLFVGRDLWTDDTTNVRVELRHLPGAKIKGCVKS